MAETVGSDKGASTAKVSPEEMLKQAVTAAAAKPPLSESVPAASVPTRRAFRLGVNGRLAAFSGAALIVGIGIGLGMATAPRERSGEALSRLRAGIEAGRAETLRLSQDVERLTRTTSALREVSEAVRTETKTLSGTLGDRIGRMEQGLDKRLATLSETVAQYERDQSARLAGLTGLVDKKLQAAANVLPKPETKVEKVEAKAETRSDPVQTGSLPDRPKSETVDNWALRDVYDGVAILEHRRRRLVEVGAGDTVPGLGRVEAIERRGRNWVVVTRQGVITPQSW